MIAAEAGYIHITGDENTPPLKIGLAITGKGEQTTLFDTHYVAPTDLNAGMNAYSSILAALLSRNQTNQGCWIDTALFDCQV